MMRDKLLQALGIFSIAVILTACATSADQRETEDSAASTPQFSQIKATPDSFKGQALVLGGQVLSARRLKDGTRLEVLQLPLNSAQQPALDLMKSQGRFVAIQREFLDPATVPQGTFLTITGELTGSMTLPLDETDYVYPLIEIKSFRTWLPSQDSDQFRYRPYSYYSPFWYPYWGPYGRFPYYC